MQEEKVKEKSEKAIISENVQKHLAKSDWKSALADMEKLFAIDQDPLVRVRMGDARKKMNQLPEAAAEYIRAADLYADRGFVVKALAQYKLALRIDPNNAEAADKMEMLHANKSIVELKLEPIFEEEQPPVQSVVPLFADLTHEEFNEFTQRMAIHTVGAGESIIYEGGTGRSVYILTHGRVRVISTVAGREAELAVLHSSDFFGEIAFLTGKPRTATVTAIEDCEVLEVTELNLRAMIEKHPHIKEVLENYHAMRLNNTIAKVKELI
jgi:cAMP-dependent protein kinase regulator